MNCGSAARRIMSGNIYHAWHILFEWVVVVEEEHVVSCLAPFDSWVVVVVEEEELLWVFDV